MEKKTHFSFFSKVFIILIACVLLYPVLVVLLGLFTIGIEDDALKRELNNQYINSNYNGWCNIELNNGNRIKLPSKWHCETIDSISAIYDEQNQLVAKGGKLSFGANSSYLYEPLVSDLLECEVTKVRTTTIQSIRSSEFGLITLNDSSKEEYYYILLSKASSYDMLFIVDTSAMNTYSDLKNILVAAVFSYVFEFV